MKRIALILVDGAACWRRRPAPRAPLPADFWGVVANEAPNPEEAATLRAGGVESFRVPINWGAVQPGARRPADWSSVDPYVRAGAEAGVSVLPFLVGAPGWAVGSEGVGGGSRARSACRCRPRPSAPPGGEFLRLAVFRYGPGGSFWAENPLLPAHPIRIWQIWNEENFKYFAARPSPSQYGKLVVDSYHDLRSADPGARIVLGGLFAPAEGRRLEARAGPDQARRTSPPTSSNGCTGRRPACAASSSPSPSIPTPTTTEQLTPEIEELRAALKASHDGGRAIWLTELGWSSGHPAPPTATTSSRRDRRGRRANCAAPSACCARRPPPGG